MSRPWMPLYVADYLADTGHLSGAEHGAYLLLIMHYWQKGSLPDDDKRLASIARASLEQWSDMRATIAEFFDDGWVHARIDAELKSAQDAYERRAAAGREGGKAKANGKQSSSNAIAGLKQSQPQSQIEKEEPSGSSKKRGTQLPENWEPDIEFALSLGLSSSQANLEAQKFREWWPAQPGQKSIKADWGLTWKTWCRKAAESRPRPHSTAPPAPRNAGERAFLKLQAEYGHEHTDNSPRRLEAGDERRQIEGNGDAWPVTGAQSAFGRS